MTLDNLSKHIYVINLKVRTDRKEHIMTQLNKINCVNYSLFEGVDGGSIENPTNLKNGMFGLVKTYLNIYDEWIKKTPDDILIIEDDCIFVDGFNNKLEHYINTLPKNWDMVYFGGNHNYHMGGKTEKINENCIKLNNTYSAHCVLLKSHVFIDLINSIKTFSIENDVKLGDLQKKYNAYSSGTCLTTQLVNYSNIENKVMDNRWLIK